MASPSEDRVYLVVTDLGVFGSEIEVWSSQELAEQRAREQRAHGLTVMVSRRQIDAPVPECRDRHLAAMPGVRLRAGKPKN